MKTRLSTLLLTGILSLCLVAAVLALASRSDQSAVAAHLDLDLLQSQSSPPHRSPQTYQPQPPGRVASPLQPAIHTSPGSSIAELMRQQAMAGSPSIELPSHVESSQGGQPKAPALPEGAAGGYLNPGLTVDLVRELVYGYTPPYTTSLVTRPADGAYGAAESDSQGFFWTSLFAGDGSGMPVDVQGGDELRFETAGAAITFSLPLEAAGGIDLVNDTVWGAIPGDSGGTPVTVTLGLWNQTSSLYDLYVAVTQPDGSFSIPLAEDVRAENFAVIDYPASPVTARTVFFPDPHAFLIWQNSHVGGYAPPFSQVDLTVYEGSSTNIRWQGSTVANFPFGWYQFDNVEMAPDDTVEMAYADGSRASTTYVYASQFTFDTTTNQVSGLTDPGTEVRLVFFDDQYHETETTAAPDGSFTATFNPLDELRPRSRVDIIVSDDSGNQSLMISGPPFVEAILDPESASDCIGGRVDVPNAPITVSLTSGGTTYTRTNPTRPSDPGNNATLDFCYLIWGPGWGPLNFSPGDIVTLRSPTWQGQVTVADLSWQADTANERVTGTAQAGDLEVTLQQWQMAAYPEHEASRVHATGSPAFTAQFTNFDVRDGQTVNLRHFDPTSDFGNQVNAALHQMQVDAPYAVTGRTPLAAEDLTVDLYDDTHTWLASTGDDVDLNPYTFRFTDFGGHALLPGYWVEISGASGWNAAVQVPAITIDGDFAADMINGEAPKTMLFIEGKREGSSFGFFTPVDGYALNTTFLGYDLQVGDQVYVHSPARDGSLTRYTSCLAEVCRVETWSNDGWDTGFWGAAEPGTVVTITAPRDTLTAYADPACDGCFNFNQSTVLYPGESFTVVAGAGTQPVVVTQPDPFAAHSDSWAGEVSGQLGGWSNRPVEIHPWGWNDMQTAQTDANGNFSASFTNMPNNAQGNIRFVDTSGNTSVIQHRPFHDLSLQIRANYIHEWVEGDYEPGHTVWITLTDALGQIKDTASGVSGVIPEWGNQSGFTTWGNTPWTSGVTPDLEVGDYVYARSDTGYTADLRIGEIDAVLDVAADLVTGSLHAPWLGQPLSGSCNIWTNNGPPGIGFDNVDPNGGAFSCDFTTVGWDIIPGMDVGVDYREPGQHDGDQIYNVLREPAPHLWIKSWGDGNPGQGSNYILAVQYNNDGDAPAYGATISMTLLEGMTYITDTSALPVSGSGVPGDPLIWQAGVLQPSLYYPSGYFEVFVQVTGAAGTLARQQVQISTLQAYFQGDPWQMQSYWESNIFTQDIELNVGKNTWTGDPVPGYDFVYEVNGCNNASTSSGEIIITDTLPLSTTLLTWWGQEPGWEEVSAADHALVVSRPSLQSYRCGRVYLKVHLDASAWPGMQLHNHAEIWGAGDADPNNNTTDLWHNAGEPHTNLDMSTNWIWGRFVPGGSLNFEFNAGNSGNIPVDNVLVTATLPAGTTFQHAYSWDQQQYPFPPDIVTDQYLVWDFGQVPNGFHRNIGVRLAIDPATPVGAALPITVTISPQPVEDRYDDNQRSWLEFVNPPGPNLRVDKHSNWRWNWKDSLELEYELRIYNLGSTAPGGLLDHR